jgi:hypothetical protein
MDSRDQRPETFFYDRVRDDISFVLNDTSLGDKSIKVFLPSAPSRFRIWHIWMLPHVCQQAWTRLLCPREDMSIVFPSDDLTTRVNVDKRVVAGIDVRLTFEDQRCSMERIA